ncbi:MAG: hypothetical protein KatS3mg131_1092 [Candidatus Tectimicrobiota bacterium]|nr:MAG: hypothetical protein KatS3mg131_1092 [Candidatus Tectomicrobia bacterium]
MGQPKVTIAPATGKLGVLLPGMGAVSTTLIAGVELIKKGLGRPIGSLTQYGTIRLGKRTEHNIPRIKDFVPLAALEDLVFGCWDIFPDNCYEAALHAGVIEPARLQQVRAELEAIVPWKAVFDQRYVRRLCGPARQAGGQQVRPGRAADGRHCRVPAAPWPQPHGDGVVRQHGSVHGARGRPQDFAPL